MRAIALRIPALLALLAAPQAARALEPVAPDGVDGLVAWYRADALAGKHGAGEPIVRWGDLSGHGHDLVSTGKPAHLRLRAAGGKAAVQVGKHERYDVGAPFDLSDHTIFLVVRASFTDRALFRSDSRPDCGVVLGERDRHLYRDGEMGRPAFAYTSALERSEKFRLVVLGRQGGRMRGFIDGADRSSMARSVVPIRVGRFFELKLSQQAESDGEGLELAEMAFYDRFLGDDERRAVSAHLAGSFDLALEEKEGGSVRERIEAISATSKTGIARLGNSVALDLSKPEGKGTVLPWDATGKVLEPWRREPEPHPTRLFATRETSAHVYLLLAVEAEQPGTRLRVLLRKSGTDWIPGEVETEPFGGPGAAGRAVAMLEARTLLEAGDYLEVVVYPTGAVRSIAGESVLLVDAE